MPEAPVLMIGTDQELVEASLVCKQLGCPGCGEVLGPWGHARGRVLVCRGGREDGVRPRRGRCRTCRTTHVLLCEGALARRP